MKSQKLSSLYRHNNFLQKQSWVNYQRFLEIVVGSIDHDHARKMSDFLRNQDFPGLVKFADYVAASEYSSPSEHRMCNQLSALVRKYPFPITSVDLKPRDRAVETFFKSERKCKRMNRVFYLFDHLRSPYERDLSVSRQWIAYVLGEFKLGDVYGECGFGPGAAIGVHGNATNDARKLLGDRWSVTTSAIHYARSAVSFDIHIQELLVRRPDSQFFPVDSGTLLQAFSRKIRIVDHNKIAFVPKTVKTERTIAVEPMLNGYLQKGLDEVMRKRMKRVGIDLKDQTLNQGLARMGSAEHSSSDPYVTIDLSSASDSISIGLCRNLVPPDWFDFMNSIRSKSFSLEGKIYPYEKFTTMGNGFCFPLETLIFASLCHAAYREQNRNDDFVVYGDDIIVRRSVADRVLRLLQVCGFTANRDKTFLEGPFRESCGADWFEGEDVRPVTLDYAFDSVENIFKFCNISREKEWCSTILHEGLIFLESLVPQELLFVRPYKGTPDSALEVPLDVFMSSPHSRYNKALQSWAWTEIDKKPWVDKSIQRVAGYNVVVTRGALRGVSSSSPFTERRKVRTKLKRVSYGGGWSLYLPGVVFSRLGDPPYPI